MFLVSDSEHLRCHRPLPQCMGGQGRQIAVSSRLAWSTSIRASVPSWLKKKKKINDLEGCQDSDSKLIFVRVVCIQTTEEGLWSRDSDLSPAAPSMCESIIYCPRTAKFPDTLLHSTLFISLTKWYSLILLSHNLKPTPWLWRLGKVASTVTANAAGVHWNLNLFLKKSIYKKFSSNLVLGKYFHLLQSCLQLT